MVVKRITTSEALQLRPPDFSCACDSPSGWCELLDLIVPRDQLTSSVLVCFFTKLLNPLSAPGRGVASRSMFPECSRNDHGPRQRPSSLIHAPATAAGSSRRAGPVIAQRCQRHRPADRNPEPNGAAAS